MSYYRNIMWDEDVTVFHKTESIVSGKKVITWESAVYSDCFWALKDKQSMEDNALVANSVHIVRIPADVNAGVTPTKGDIAVKGSVTDTVTGTPTELMKKYDGNCFYISSITDNTKLKRTAHWLISDK